MAAAYGKEWREGKESGRRDDLYYSIDSTETLLPCLQPAGARRTPTPTTATARLPYLLHASRAHPWHWTTPSSHTNSPRTATAPGDTQPHLAVTSLLTQFHISLSPKFHFAGVFVERLEKSGMMWAESHVFIVGWWLLFDTCCEGWDGGETACQPAVGEREVVMATWLMTDGARPGLGDCRLDGSWSFSL